MPSPLLGRKIFNFYPSKLFMISKHDLLKRLWAFVHIHLISILVCSVWAQQTSFRICSTDLFDWEHGREHKIELPCAIVRFCFGSVSNDHFSSFENSTKFKFKLSQLIVQIYKHVLHQEQLDGVTSSCCSWRDALW